MKPIPTQRRLDQAGSATARRAPADRAALEVHLAAGLIRIAHGSSALRHDEVTRVRVLREAAALADRHPMRREAGTTEAT